MIKVEINTMKDTIRVFNEEKGIWESASISRVVKDSPDLEAVTPVETGPDYLGELVAAIENKKQKQEICVFKSDGTLGKCGVTLEEWQRVCDKYAVAKKAYDESVQNG